jgi:hypothetical protein
MNENEKTQEQPEKKNYCDKEGNCTCASYPDELNCIHRKQAFMRGGCIYRVWFEDRCLSQFAQVDAKEAAANGIA